MKKNIKKHIIKIFSLIFIGFIYLDSWKSIHACKCARFSLQNPYLILRIKLINLKRQNQTQETDDVKIVWEDNILTYKVLDNLLDLPLPKDLPLLYKKRLEVKSNDDKVYDYHCLHCYDYYGSNQIDLLEGSEYLIFVRYDLGQELFYIDNLTEIVDHQLLNAIGSKDTGEYLPAGMKYEDAVEKIVLIVEQAQSGVNTPLNLSGSKQDLLNQSLLKKGNNKAFFQYFVEDFSQNQVQYILLAVSIFTFIMFYVHFKSN